MADEITFSFHLVAQKTGVETVNKKLSGFQMDMSGQDTHAGTQTLSTSEELLQLGDAVVGGVILIKNHSDSISVYLRPASGETNCVEIGPQEQWPFRLATGSTPYLIAASGTPRVSYTILDP